MISFEILLFHKNGEVSLAQFYKIVPVESWQDVISEEFC